MSAKCGWRTLYLLQEQGRNHVANVDFNLFYTCWVYVGSRSGGRPMKGCRACGCDVIGSIWEAGAFPVANRLLQSSTDKAPALPLSLVKCWWGCGLVQLDHDADPTDLFTSYDWVTGTSPSTLRYLGRLAESITSMRPGSKILEVASNDGSLLWFLRELGHDVRGIDPAKNIAADATARGLPTDPWFFNTKSPYEPNSFDVIIARNVLAHTPEPMELLHGIKRFLSHKGLAIIEFHDADTIAQQLQYDSVYAEHYSYWDERSLKVALTSVGLEILNITRSPINHGNKVAWIKVKTTKTAEAPTGRNVNWWSSFTRRVNYHQEALFSVLSEFSDYIAYGASARSSTLLNALMLPPKQIIDNNPRKVGKFMPLYNADPVRIVNHKNADFSLAVLITAWNFYDEIKSSLPKGVTVIRPLPYVHVEVT